MTKITEDGPTTPSRRQAATSRLDSVASLTQTIDPRRTRFRSDLDDLTRDFFVPCLSAAVTYDRAVGYFTSGSLALVGESLEPFLQHAERMRLVASPHLTRADHVALEDASGGGSISREDALARVVETRDDRAAYGISLLTSLLAAGVLEIFIATGYDDQRGDALYHEKIGLLVDAYGNYVTFEGSPNETAAAWGHNIESFPIHRSWVEGEARHAQDARDDVNELFAFPSRRRVRVRPLPEAFAEQLILTYEPSRRVRTRKGGTMRHDEPAPGDTPTFNVPLPRVPSGLSLHDYQEAAVGRWIANNGRGVFEMATGTGKTITALAALTRAIGMLIERDRPPLVVIAVPDRSLLASWKREAAEFGIDVHSSGDINLRSRPVADAIRLLEGGDLPYVALLTTVDSATNDQFDSHLDAYAGARILVADEAHSFATATRTRVLRDDYHFRLALSATFARHRDEAGTNTLRAYFGETCACVTLYDAIHIHHTLVPYSYHPIVVPLDEEERTRYLHYSALGASALARGNEDAANSAFGRRADLVKNARAKVKAFGDVLATMPDEHRSGLLIFTAEGEAEIHGIVQRDAVGAALDQLRLRWREYIGDTSPADRVAAEQALERGELDALVAMKCLDQGVDIPDARVGVFLASTQNPQQYVQRRGRILRRPKREDSTKTSAVLYDFIVDPDVTRPDASASVRHLIEVELTRASYMAGTASNKWASWRELEPLVKKYGLPVIPADEDANDDQD